MRLLLSVASLSRVVEWFEAERQFWNFDEASGTPGTGGSASGGGGGLDDMDDDQGEMLTFVLKPASNRADRDKDRDREGSSSGLHASYGPGGTLSTPALSDIPSSGTSAAGSVNGSGGTRSVVTPSGALGMSTSGGLGSGTASRTSTPHSQPEIEAMPSLSRTSSAPASVSLSDQSLVGGTIRGRPSSAQPMGPPPSVELSVSMSSTSRGAGEFEHFGSSVIGDEDAAHMAQDQLDDDDSGPPLSQPTPQSQAQAHVQFLPPPPPFHLDSFDSLPEEDRPRSPEATRSGSQHSNEDEQQVTHEERVEATESLRIQAEQAQNMNIVLELTLDGEGGQQFAWINPAWFDVIG